MAPLDSKLVDMANQSYRRHSEFAFPFRPGFFSSLQAGLHDSYMVCVAKRGADTLGFVTMLADGDTAWADSYGLDSRRSDTAFVYFYLAYHWPIRAAIERGLRRIVFGRGQYELKLRRGCSLTDTYVLVKPSGRISRTFHAGLLHVVDRSYAKQVPTNRHTTPDPPPGTGNPHRMT